MSARPVYPSSDCRAFFSSESTVIAPGWTRTSVRPWPVDPPALAREWRPNQLLRRCSPCVVIQRGGALVEAAGMPGIAEAELQEV